MDIHCT